MGTEKSRKHQWFEVLKLRLATNSQCQLWLHLTQCILKTLETRVDLVGLVV